MRIADIPEISSMKEFNRPLTNEERMLILKVIAREEEKHNKECERIIGVEVKPKVENKEDRE